MFTQAHTVESLDQARLPGMHKGGLSLVSLALRKQCVSYSVSWVWVPSSITCLEAINFPEPQFSHLQNRVIPNIYVKGCVRTDVVTYMTEWLAWSKHSSVPLWSVSLLDLGPLASPASPNFVPAALEKCFQLPLEYVHSISGQNISQ